MIHPIVTELAKIRRARGMTQEALGHACGWSPALISKWETGVVEPRPAQIQHMAQALRARVTWEVEWLP